MKLRFRFNWRRHKWSGMAGFVLTLAVGVVCIMFNPGERLKLLSYDMPVATHATEVPGDAVIVYLDDESHKVLEQSKNEPWDRELHAQLLQRLKEQQARLVVFDIEFPDAAEKRRRSTAAELAADDHFAAAIREHGGVILAAVESKDRVARREVTFKPADKFLKAAKGWGTSTLLIDQDFGVRRFITQEKASPTLAIATVKALDPNRPLAKREVSWLHYYDRPDSVPHVSYFQVLSNWASPGAFRDKVVFVGAKQNTGLSGDGKDTFATAYTASRHEFSTGTEIHATAFMNLLHGEWLTHLPEWAELALAFLIAMVFGFGLVSLSTIPACVTAAMGSLLIIVPAHFIVWQWHEWFAWAVLVLQVGVALGWSVVFNSVCAYVEKRDLERALELHLPKRRVKQLLKSPELLTTSAEKQEVSLMFTDIANWSTISERITPDRLFKLLNNYFQQTIPCIHDEDGMTLQLIGDAIFAVWNAPEPQGNHQQLACAAALSLRDKLVQFESANESYPLRTRVGLHCGLASVGNVGSEDRLVYTALGAETNMASRLEGLNKYLGTDILASDRIVEPVEDKFVWRNMGRFRLKGGDRVMEIYELVDTLEKAEASRAWRQAFSDARRKFSRAEFDGAEAAFRQMLELKPKDKPALFYLETIEHFRQTPPAKGWMGEVNMESK